MFERILSRKPRGELSGPEPEDGRGTFAFWALLVVFAVSAVLNAVGCNWGPKP